VELSARGLTRRYPGVLALDGVDVDFKGGEIHAVVGENGAGKSTLMKLLSGAVAPDAGTLLIDGTPIRFDSPHAAQALGIRMIHQELALVPELTVAENIVLGSEPASQGVIRRAAQRATARASLERLGQHDLDIDAPIGTLSLASQQMAEIAKAMVHQVSVLVLDEPTAILSHDETGVLLALLRQLRAEGVAIVFVSHRLDEVFEIADRITVLRDGRLISSSAAAAISRPDVVRQMVGRELAETFPEPVGTIGAEVLRVANVRSGIVRDASLTVHAGETVALAGLVGAGRTELVRAIFGAARVTAGTMTLRGEPYAPRTPRDAIAAGVALIPEDRKRQALNLIASTRDNMMLATLDRVAAFGVVKQRAEDAAVRRWIDGLSIKAASPEQEVRLLSGGNQQKVVVARWMLANCSVLLFDEPTRGVDVGAKAEIYALMRQLTREGAAIVMISSELPEAIGMADRVIVMREGRTVGELARRDASADRVARLILGEERAA
jgi:ribose transport system ATP-binding protein